MILWITAAYFVVAACVFVVFTVGMQSQWKEESHLDAVPPLWGTLAHAAVFGALWPLFIPAAASLVWGKIRARRVTRP